MKSTAIQITSWTNNSRYFVCFLKSLANDFREFQSTQEITDPRWSGDPDQNGYTMEHNEYQHLFFIFGCLNPKI